MSVCRQNYYIKTPKPGQTVSELHQQLLAFHSRYGKADNFADGIQEYSVGASEVSCITEDGKAVLVPFYDGFVLSEVRSTELLRTVLENVSDWYAGILHRVSMGELSMLIHGDLHLGNIIVQPNTKRIILIDALSKPAEAGFIWVDFLTLSTSICIHPDIDRSQASKMCTYLGDEISNKSSFLLKFRFLIRAWLLLQLRFMTSDSTFVEKWKASRALFASVQIWLKVFR